MDTQCHLPQKTFPIGHTYQFDSSMQVPFGLRTAGLISKVTDSLKAAKSFGKSPFPKFLHPGHRDPKKYFTVMASEDAKVAVSVASRRKAFILARRWIFVEFRK